MKRLARTDLRIKLWEVKGQFLSEATKLKGMERSKVLLPNLIAGTGKDAAAHMWFRGNFSSLWSKDFWLPSTPTRCNGLRYEIHP